MRIEVILEILFLFLSNAKIGSVESLFERVI